MEQKITVRNNQSLLDIAIQETGAIESVLDAMRESSLSVSAILAPGSKVVLTGDTQNVDIKGYYKGNKLSPSTGISGYQAPGDAEVGEGIEYWAIEVDFIVS
jgi:hypothetical protein